VTADDEVVARYVIDHSALMLGLISGTEEQRKGLSGLLAGAATGDGPTVAVPALCAAAADRARPGLLEHVADVIAEAQPGRIELSGLARSDRLDASRDVRSDLDWPTRHAVLQAGLAGAAIITASAEAYSGTGMVVREL
jgi:hypothetical protein